MENDGAGVTGVSSTARGHFPCQRGRGAQSAVPGKQRKACKPQTTAGAWREDDGASAGAQISLVPSLYAENEGNSSRSPLSTARRPSPRCCKVRRKNDVVLSAQTSYRGTKRSFLQLSTRRARCRCRGAHSSFLRGDRGLTRAVLRGRRTASAPESRHGNTARSGNGGDTRKRQGKRQKQPGKRGTAAFSGKFRV